jgi:hypothetical protein
MKAPGDYASDGGIGDMILEVAHNILVSFRQGSLAVSFYFVTFLLFRNNCNSIEARLDANSEFREHDL